MRLIIIKISFIDNVPLPIFPMSIGFEVLNLSLVEVTIRSYHSAGALSEILVRTRAEITAIREQKTSKPMNFSTLNRRCNYFPLPLVHNFRPKFVGFEDRLSSITFLQSLQIMRKFPHLMIYFFNYIR